MRRIATLLIALAVAASSLAGQPRTSTHTSTSVKVRKPAAKPSVAKAKRASRASSTAPLRGSAAILKRQDKRLEEEKLEPIEDNRDLAARVKNGLLVPVPVSKALTVDSELAKSRRYTRPWTAQYLTALARDHEAAFQTPLEVSSAVRTVAYQKLLKRTNSNAAPAEGALFSPHVMGSTVDISKGDLTRAEILWMRRRLRADSTAGKIDVEEEFRQACFHITVYKPKTPAASTLAQTPKPSTQLTASLSKKSITQPAKTQRAANQPEMQLIY